MSIQHLTLPLLQIDLKPSEKAPATVYVLGPAPKAKIGNDLKAVVQAEAQDFQIQKLLESDKKQLQFTGRTGTVWILKPIEIQKGQHYGFLEESEYGWYRE